MVMREVTVVMSEDLAKTCQKWARVNDRSVSSWVKDCIAQGIERERQRQRWERRREERLGRIRRVVPAGEKQGA